MVGDAGRKGELNVGDICGRLGSLRSLLAALLHDASAARPRAAFRSIKIRLQLLND